MAATSTAFHLFTPVKGPGARTYCGQVIARDTLLLAVAPGGARPQRMDVCPQCLARNSLRSDAADTAALPERISLMDEAVRSVGNEGTVLVVDDDVAIREELVDGLTEAGFPTASAADGREALHWLGTHSAVTRAVLLDLMMPEMNGLEFLAEKEARGSLDEIPVLVMTAALGKTATLDGRVRALFHKPLSLDGVIRSLRLCPPPAATRSTQSRRP